MRYLVLFVQLVSIWFARQFNYEWFSVPLVELIWVCSRVDSNDHINDQMVIDHTFEVNGSCGTFAGWALSTYVWFRFLINLLSFTEHNLAYFQERKKKAQTLETRED